MLGSATVGAALGVLVTASAAMLGATFVGSHLLQEDLGMDPLRTSLVALPGGVMMVLGAPMAAVLLSRWGARRTALTGTLLLTAGVPALSRLGPESAALAIGAGFLLVGGGFGAVMVTTTAVVVRHAPPGAAEVVGRGGRGDTHAARRGARTVPAGRRGRAGCAAHRANAPIRPSREGWNTARTER